MIRFFLTGVLLLWELTGYFHRLLVILFDSPIFGRSLEELDTAYQLSTRPVLGKAYMLYTSCFFFVSAIVD